MSYIPIPADTEPPGEIYQLGNDDIGAYVIHFPVKENYTVFEHTGIEIVRSLSAVSLLHDHGHKFVSYHLNTSLSYPLIR